MGTNQHGRPHMAKDFPYLPLSTLSAIKCKEIWFKERKEHDRWYKVWATEIKRMKKTWRGSHVPRDFSQQANFYISLMATYLKTMCSVSIFFCSTHDAFQMTFKDRVMLHELSHYWFQRAGIILNSSWTGLHLWWHVSTSHFPLEDKEK